MDLEVDPVSTGRRISSRVIRQIEASEAAPLREVRFEHGPDGGDEYAHHEYGIRDREDCIRL
jgi:hypothetical protein